MVAQWWQADGPFKPMSEWLEIVGQPTHDETPSVRAFAKSQKKASRAALRRKNVRHRASPRARHCHATSPTVNVPRKQALRELACSWAIMIAGHVAGSCWIARSVSVRV